ncbi:MAG: CPBP family intramembrane metalloprotease [Lachnospiraceae bacterium]|nr:CPBP family intramembrane metalloprotease [Lachnospiraceae bacterium]
MELNEERRRLNPLHGIGMFLIVILVFIFVFAPLQYYFGMVGLVVTELGLLLITLISTRIAGQSFREVFPIYRPKLGQIGGTILLWVGCFLSVMIATIILMYLFPEGFLDVSNSMNTMFSSTPAVVTFLIVAVLPAICEEAMHRGFILHTFKNISSDWIVVLCMGLIFGIFHLDPYRFLPTALLGMGLTYIMRKTHNMVLPALFHFINNGMSVLSSLISSTEDTAEAASILADRSYLLLALGSYLMIGFLAPVLLFVGSYLLRKSSGCLPKRSDARLVLTTVFVILLSVSLLIAGFCIIFLNMNTWMEMEEVIQEIEPFM